MASAHLLHMIYGRTRLAGVEEDLAMTTHHFYSEAATWPDTAPFNYESAETVIDDWWASIKINWTPFIKLAELRWYREDDLQPPWGPPARVTARNVAGTANVAFRNLPPQCALSVTEYTGYHEREAGRDVRHWGRFYLPAPSTAMLTDDGAVQAASVDTVADAVDTLYAGWTACGLTPAVRITGWGGPVVPQAGWVPVQEIRVDNLWDTIRRRRYETVTLRSSRDTFAGPEAPE